MFPGISILVLLAAFTVSFPASASSDEFVRVSPDGWHFETSRTHTRFVPFGGVYYDPDTYTDKLFPRFFVITKLDEERTDRHFAQIAETGANLVRISLSTGVFSPEYRKLDEKAFEKLDRIVVLAGKHGLRVILDLYVEWEGRAEWVDPPWESYTSEKAIRGFEFLYSAYAERYKNEPTVFSYLLCDEHKIPWDSKGMRAAWSDWARSRYRTEDKLKRAWDDYPGDSESWTSILPPADENKPGSRRLYDYQLFREDVAEKFVGRLARAIRSKDKNHLVSLGNVQWVAPMRIEGLTPDLLKPSSYPAFNPQKIGRHLDYLHINSYDWWDDKYPEFTQAMGRFTYFPGKPVILGEFSFDPKIVGFTRGSFSGYCAWAFYPLPSEPSLHYLFDKDGNITEHGKAFASTAAKVRAGELTFDRSKEEAILVVDAVEALTDVSTHGRIFRTYVKMAEGGKVVGMSVKHAR